MPKPANAADALAAHLSRAGDGDVLHFLTRTLQAHIIDAEPQDVLAKLQNLRTALEQQELTLAGWPDSASKHRICVALAKARKVVSRIVEDIDAAGGADDGACSVNDASKAM